MFGSDYVPFDFASAMPMPALPAAEAFPLGDDGFAAGRQSAQFERFRDERAATVTAIQPEAESLAALAALAAPTFPWSAGLERLKALPAPDYLEPASWDRIVWTALRFSDQWGEQAEQHGWTVLQLFGANPDPLAARRDRNGVVTSLALWTTPIEVQAISADCIALLSAGRDRLSFYHFDPMDAVPLWVAYSPRGGP